MQYILYALILFGMYLGWKGDVRTSVTKKLLIVFIMLYAGMEMWYVYQAWKIATFNNFGTTGTGLIYGTYLNGTTATYLSTNDLQVLDWVRTDSADFLVLQFVQSFIWLPFVIFVLAWCYDTMKTYAELHGFKIA